MAIDDNTSYELTGYQVKDIAQKIRAKADSASLASVATSGLYSDLTGAPTIPTVYNGTLTLTQNGTSAGTFTANSSTDTTIALTDTTYSAFTGTDGQTAGTSGLVPAPATTDDGKFLKADGTWDTAGSSAVTIYANWGGFLSSYSGDTVTFYDGANTSTANVISGADFYTLVTSGVRVEIRPVTSVSNKDYVYVVTSNLLYSGSSYYAATIEGCGYVINDGGVVGNLEYFNDAGINTFHIYWKSIPTVNDGTLTIQHNGTTKGTFTANQSSASTVNIETIYADDQIVTTPIDWSNILSHFYPVGSIYMSATLSTAAAVGEVLGGTWVAWGAGRVPVGVDTSDSSFDAVEETGGAKTHTHDLSNAHADLLMDSSSGIYYREKSTTQWNSNYKINVSSGGGAAGAHNYGTVLSGSTGSGSNLQPYITCYMYKRTA